MEFNMSTMNQLAPMSNEASQTLSSTFNPDKHVVKLFVFSPRHVVDTCKRSQMYNFSMTFLNDMIENVSNIWNNPSGNLQHRAFMDGVPSALDSIVPQAQGSTMNNKIFGDCWTFLLQIDNDQFNNVGLITGHKLINRLVYSGIFLNDAPISMLDGVSVTINPNAILKITHSTVLSKNACYLPSMGDYMKTTVNQDVDYIPADITKFINPEVDAFLHPKIVAQSMVSMDNSRVITDGSAQLGALANQGTIPIDSSFSSPKHHLHTLMGSVMSTLEQTSADTLTNGSIHNNVGFINSVDNIKETFVNCIPGSPSDWLISLDGTQVYTLAELHQKYPQMEVIPITAPKQINEDLANQSVVSRANVGSSVLVNAIPMLMTNSGLCELAFMYRTFSANSFVNIGNEDTHSYTILNVAPWMQEDAKITRMRIQAFMSIFKSQVVPTILNIGGEFDLSVSCNAAGECDCMLNYLDDRNGTQGIYESPLLLGGLNSSMVGTDTVLQNNLSNMASLQTAIYSEIPNLVPVTGEEVFSAGINPLDNVVTSDEKFAENLFNSSF